MLAQMITNDTAYTTSHSVLVLFLFPSPRSFHVLIHLADVSVTISSHSIDGDL